MFALNDQQEIDIKRVLDGSGITGTVRQRYEHKKRTPKGLRRWKREQVQKAVLASRAAGILPTGLAWWLIKIAVEAFIRRYLFGVK